MEIRYEKLNHGNFGGRSLDEFIRHQTKSEGKFQNSGFT